MNHANQLTDLEKELLRAVNHAKRFAVARFELRSTQERSLISTALGNVWMERPDDSMDIVKARGEALQSLADKGLVTINFGFFIAVVSDYEIYRQSGLFAQLGEMVAEGRGRPGFLFDIPAFKKGIVQMTALGKETLRHLG